MSPPPLSEERSLDEIADALYALRPDAFAAARDEQVRKARADGRQPLARELAKLRRPTLSAWLINLVWRDQREVLEQLFELADSLSRAQAEAAGDELRQLMTVRRQLELTLIRRAHALAAEAGVDVTETVEREAQETLAAALAQPEVADEVRTGRLVKPASYAGFGPSTPAPTRPSPPKPAEVVDLRLKADQRARERREAAERRIQEARRAAEAAASALAERESAVEAALQHHESLREQLEDLREQLRRLEQDVAQTEQAVLAAQQCREQAQQAHQAARQTLERAERSLAEEA
jgi:DNA repair exonuclease SbcCD ATPase subunit